jgi:hypothetical protein
VPPRLCTDAVRKIDNDFRFEHRRGAGIGAGCTSGGESGTTAPELRYQPAGLGSAQDRN